MTNDERRGVYLRDRAVLTPAQRRRLRHRENAASSERVQGGLSRYARLRKRFDRKDERRIRFEARNVAWWVQVQVRAKRGDKNAQKTIQAASHKSAQRRGRRAS